MYISEKGSEAIVEAKRRVSESDYLTSKTLLMDGSGKFYNHNGRCLSHGEVIAEHHAMQKVLKDISYLLRDAIAQIKEDKEAVDER